MGEQKIVKTTCKGCHGGCGVLVTVEDGVITHIEGDPDRPTKGTMCAKGLSSIQHIDNPYRLKYPLKRIGKKGEGKWQRISWDEALDIIEEKVKDSIEKYGPSSIAISQGTGRGCNRYVHRLARSIGSANTVTPGYICHSPRLGIYGLVTGYSRLYADYHGWGGEFPKTQIVLAKQLEISSADGELAYFFLNSLNYIKNLIIVDPRATAFTSRAALWLQIRPGTDAALLLGMMNVIINEGLYDKEFVENWTHGFDKLKERVQEYPPTRVAEITWIPEEKIVQAARMFAIDTPGTIQVGSSIERQANCGQTMRAVVDLLGITGNVERPGSMMSWVLPDTGLIENFFMEIPMTDEMKCGIRGGGVYKLGAARTAHSDTVMKEIRDGNPQTVKVMISIAGQQIIHLAATPNVVKALESENYFQVQLDQFMGPQAEHADIVLPAAHWLEMNDIFDMHPRFMIEAINKCVEPPGEAWPDNKIALEIGRRIAPQYWPWETVEEMLDHQLRHGNITWNEFSEKTIMARMGKEQIYYKYKTDYWRKGGGFPTPTGKLELYSTVLEELGYDPLPCFVEPGESPYSTPELYKEYPLVLTSGYRQPFFFLSQYRNIPWLRSFGVYPIAQINPETAKKLGIKDGDWMWIESPRGRIRQVARLFPGIDPRVVMTTGNCFYPEEPGALHGVMISSPNVLTSDEHFDPMFGSPDLTCLLCKVYKVEKKDMKDLPQGAYRLQSYEGDIGAVPFGQEGKIHKK
jgi:anaerobic selenocysteine-containing dehydrogenase